ncbi:MAG: xanthine dehydrogenase family protein subunit M [bacterium]|nr:xanthine dehydrogenase family protein subunit M [bacterium]
MFPAPFEYHRAKSLDEAIGLLQKYGEAARLLSGGHSLIPILKSRLARPEVIIDIARIPGLAGIVKEKNAIAIGGLTTHHEIAASPEIRAGCPLLSETASQIGDLQVRNRGTIGGSLSHADPAADYPAAVLALRADLVATGPKGARSIASDDFFTGPLETALADGEILTAVRIPLGGGARSGGAYGKAAQQASGFAVCGVAVRLTLGAGGEVAAAGVGVTGVAASAYRAEKTEAALIGEKPTDDLIRKAASLAAEGIDPLDDFYASGAFRKSLAAVWAGRAIRAAYDRATR